MVAHLVHGRLLLRLLRVHGRLLLHGLHGLHLSCGRTDRGAGESDCMQVLARRGRGLTWVGCVAARHATCSGSKGGENGARRHKRACIDTGALSGYMLVPGGIIRGICCACWPPGAGGRAPGCCGLAGPPLPFWLGG